MELTTSVPSFPLYVDPTGRTLDTDFPLSLTLGLLGGDGLARRDNLVDVDLLGSRTTRVACAGQRRR